MGRFYGSKGDVQKAGPEGNNARRDGSPEARRSGPAVARRMGSEGPQYKVRNRYAALRKRYDALASPQ